MDGSIVSEVVWHPPFEEDEEEDEEDEEEVDVEEEEEVNFVMVFTPR